MKDFDQEYIRFSDLKTQFSESGLGKWMSQACRLLIKRSWLVLIFAGLGYGLGHTIQSQKVPSAEATLLINSQYLKKASLSHFIENALSYDSIDFQSKLGLGPEDYVQLKKIKKLNRMYRHDWFRLTPFYGTANDNDYAWLIAQDINILALELTTTEISGLQKSLEALLENSQPILDLKQETRSKFLQLEKTANEQLKEILRSYQSNKDLELFQDFYWRLRYEKIKTNFELNQLNNITFFSLSSPKTIGGYQLIEVLNWCFGFLILGALLALFWKVKRD